MESSSTDVSPNKASKSPRVGVPMYIAPPLRSANNQSPKKDTKMNNGENENIEAKEHQKASPSSQDKRGNNPNGRKSPPKSGHRVRIPDKVRQAREDESQQSQVVQNGSGENGHTCKNNKEETMKHTRPIPEQCCGEQVQETILKSPTEQKVRKKSQKKSKNHRSPKIEDCSLVNERELSPRSSEDAPIIDKPCVNTKQQEDFEFTENDFHSLNSLYIDSHTHTDFIYRVLNRIRRNKGGSLKDWISAYPKAFPKNFAGCIANFIEPELFVEHESTLDSSDAEWIMNELQCSAYLGTTFGCHPHHAERWDSFQPFWEQLENIFSKFRATLRVVGIGECGIDLYKSESSLDHQIRVFRRHIELAFRYDLTLVIHCRGTPNKNAEIQCLQILKEEMERCEKGHHRNLRIHRHCYTEDWKNAQEWIRLCPNIVFGYTPAVFSFKESQLEAVRMIPLDRIVLETDAPYFKPRPLDSVSPPKCSLPGIASSVAFRIAKMKNISVEEVLRSTYNNTMRIYNLPL